MERTWRIPTIYNAPGVTGVGGNILSGIVEALAPDKSISIPSVLSISNIIAAGDIVSDVGLYISSPIEVTVEAQSALGAHSILGLTDTLAVYSLFSQVDTSLTILEIATILKASTNETNHMHESTITAIGKLLISASVIESLAQIDIACRYALVNLNPFVIDGVVYDGIEGADQSDHLYGMGGNDSIYKIFNGNGENDLLHGVLEGIISLTGTAVVTGSRTRVGLSGGAVCRTKRMAPWNTLITKQEKP